MSEQKVVTFGDYRATVRKASLYDGIVMGRLVTQASEAAYADDVLKAVGLYVWPYLMAVSEFECPEPEVDAQGRITLEFLAGLPDDFVENWLATVYELNPHWRAGGSSQTEITEKKA
jgi:hypothetical protein